VVLKTACIRDCTSAEYIDEFPDVVVFAIRLGDRLACTIGELGVTKLFTIFEPQGCPSRTKPWLAPKLSPLLRKKTFEEGLFMKNSLL
jgi:hypothetical protein